VNTWIAILGIATLALGLFVRFGGFKRWYVVRGRAMWSEAVRYGLIPLGFAIIAAVVAAQLIPGTSPPGGTEFWIFLTMLLVALTVGAGKPRWLQPHWLLWLIDNYPDQMEALLEDARRNSWTWQERVQTQQGLEAWAREVAGEPQPVVYTTLNEVVRSFVMLRSLQRSFSIDDIKRDCPDIIGRWRIRRVLRRLQREGKLTRTGRGRSARWRRV
jgi:hypothetical protein